jgi:hypothetical protein
MVTSANVTSRRAVRGKVECGMRSLCLRAEPWDTSGLRDRIARLGARRATRFVFARDTSGEAILEAIRARRTVVYGRNGKAYGDPELIRLAAADGRLPMAARPDYSPSLPDRVSQLLGLAGLVGLVAINRRRHHQSRS